VENGMLMRFLILENINGPTEMATPLPLKQVL
jgi:hypothetical protein